MSDTKETLTAWRAEIAGELDKAREDLAAAEEKRSAAATAAQHAVDAHTELRNTLRAITNRPAGFASLPLAGPLARRVEEHDRAVKDASNSRARTHGARENCVRHISELERALEQIDQIISPAPETEEDASWL